MSSPSRPARPPPSRPQPPPTSLRRRPCTSAPRPSRSRSPAADQTHPAADRLDSAVAAHVELRVHVARATGRTAQELRPQQRPDAQHHRQGEPADRAIVAAGEADARRVVLRGALARVRTRGATRGRKPEDQPRRGAATQPAASRACAHSTSFRPRGSRVPPREVTVAEFGLEGLPDTPRESRNRRADGAFPARSSSPAHPRATARR